MFNLSAKNLKRNQPGMPGLQQNLKRKRNRRSNRLQQRRTRRHNKRHQHHREQPVRSASPLEPRNKVAAASCEVLALSAKPRRVRDIELAINELHVPYLRQFPIGTNPNFAIPPKAAPELPDRLWRGCKTVCCACLLRAIRYGGGLGFQGVGAGDIRCSLRSPCCDRRGLCGACSRIARSGAGRGRPGSASRAEARTEDCRRWRRRVSCTVCHLLYDAYYVTHSISCQEEFHLSLIFLSVSSREPFGGYAGL